MFDGFDANWSILSYPVWRYLWYDSLSANSSPGYVLIVKRQYRIK